LNQADLEGLKKPGLVEVYGIVWRHGSGRERLLLILVNVPLALLVAGGFWLGWEMLKSGLPLEFVLAWAYTAFAWFGCQRAFNWAIMNGDVIRELRRRGRFDIPEGEVNELLRYLETHGESGRLPGATKWGLAYAVLLCALLGGSLPFTIVVLPIGGVFTPYLYLVLVAGAAILMSIAHLRRIHRLFERAKAQGFQFEEARPRDLEPPRRPFF
jgi:hypothetical protein